MFRGNWRKLSALIIGLIALGGLTVAYELYDASEQHQSDYQYQPAAKSHISALIVGKSPAKAYEPSCQNPQGNSDADLCAQWAAVEQVVESNRLASLNARLAVFVAFLSTLGTGLLIWTFKETRDTSRRELRAYLFPEDVGCFEIIETKKNKLGRESKHKTGIVGAGVAIKNSGQTPAYKVRHIAEVCICKVSEEARLKIESKSLSGFDNPMPPGGLIHKNLRMGATPSPEQLAGLQSGNYAVYVYGKIEYEDAFGRSRFTEYRFIWFGWPIPDNIMMNFAQSGNDAN